MSTEKRPLKVFLCHASVDKPKVRELYRYLRRRGIQPWLDAEDLVGGQNWREEIPNAIRTSEAIIICLSKNSINKEGFVQAEIAFALEKALEIPQGRIFIIPARFEECDVPHSLERFHWVDLFEKDGFPKLMKALRTRASQLERATVLVPQPDDTTPDLTSTSEEKVENKTVERDERRKAGGQTAHESEKEKTTSKYFEALRSTLTGAIPFFRVAGILAIIIIFFWGGQLALSQILPLMAPAKATATQHTIANTTSTNSSFPPTKTRTPETPPLPILTASPEIQQYFTEEFDNGYKNWSYFLRRGGQDKFSLSVENGGLVFKMAGKRIYAYLVYEPLQYKDVRIDVHTENFGVNENNITLFCRYSPNAGWYEFNIFSNGLYTIFYTKPDGNGSFKDTLIANGGSNIINQGHAVNEYSAICAGNTLTLYINGVLTKTVNASKYELSDGKVGFSVSSFDIVPVQVSLDWIRISEP